MIDGISMNNGVSLIVATLGKCDITPLLESLKVQTCNNFECIVVDQSNDDSIGCIASKYNFVKHIRSVKTGNSYNRNIGIKNASMPILGFPDDDCYYSQDVIRNVLKYFELSDSLSGVSGAWVDSITNKVVMSGKGGGHATIFNIWSTITNLTVFLRKEVVNAVNGYDEMFGLGSNMFEGGEETDLMIKILNDKHTICFDPQIRIFHRQDRYLLSNYKKQRGYEESWGALFGKWYNIGNNKAVIILILIYIFAKALIAAAYYVVKGDITMAKRYIDINRARIDGWVKYNKLIIS